MQLGPIRRVPALLDRGHEPLVRRPESIRVGEKGRPPRHETKAEERRRRVGESRLVPLPFDEQQNQRVRLEDEGRPVAGTVRP
jgi:hypothetical protein